MFASTLIRRTRRASLVDNAIQYLCSSSSVFSRSYAASATPLLVAMIGQRKPMSAIHRKIESTGAEVKESRNVSLGGKSSNLFLVVNADVMELKREFANEHFDFFSVFDAVNTVRDIKGPYCESSPLAAFVRKVKMQVPYKSGVVNEIGDFLCSKGVIVSHMDEFRSGKDIVLEGILHLPTGLAEFPAIEESYILKKLEGLGVFVSEFGKVDGKPRVKAATS
jgi:glycine cleavage system regulatory protein